MRRIQPKIALARSIRCFNPTVAILKLYVLERSYGNKNDLVTNSNFWQNTGQQEHALYSLQPIIACNKCLFDNSGNIRSIKLWQQNSKHDVTDVVTWHSSECEWVWVLWPFHVTGSLPREQLTCIVKERSRKWEQTPGAVISWTRLWWLWASGSHSHMCASVTKKCLVWYWLNAGDTLRLER